MFMLFVGGYSTCCACSNLQAQRKPFLGPMQVLSRWLLYHSLLKLDCAPAALYTGSAHFLTSPQASFGLAKGPKCPGECATECPRESGCPKE